MKVAVVTGGTKGIGKAIVEMLLANSYFVYLTYSKDDSVIERLTKELNQISESYRICRVDQSNPVNLHSFTETLKQECCSIDCIVCNAGATLRKSSWEISDEEWENIFNVSVNSHFYLIRDLHSLILNNSRIIFIGSLLGCVPHATSLPYGVSKAAVHALAKNLVKDFEGTGTTVNVIAPGFVETEWQKTKPQNIRDNIYAKTAVKRFAEPSEIANAVQFCIENAFVNGTIIEVNGGYSFK